MAALPEDAFAANCIGAALLTVLTWDLAICLAEELSVVTICRFSHSIVVYYTSRVGILVMCAMQLVIRNARITNCSVFWNIETTVIIIVSSATSLLFLLRVRAVYEKSTSITVLFGILWTAIPVSSILVGIFGRPQHIPSGLCVPSEIQIYVSIALWVKAMYDTSVFTAITLRVISYSKVGQAPVPKPSRWQSWRGGGMPRIVRELAHGAHQFYFITIGVTLMGACAILLPINAIYRMSLTQPALTMESIMACRVFRKLVLSAHRARTKEPETKGRVPGHAVDTSSIMLTTVLPYQYAPEERETNIV
ncbi:hypothetical protein FIBSPDRAFT_1053761 [Athelia psychrophila]|uniref:Uncharacterized protein n=1 Tax=Athelia psychrophila TaxID=1759441 RepID=A0A167WE59_9AGAM|nr:hypothetical protein FIBSPDRAFT_1053761 [Fibularhizoctonia sp. CBS 109695]